MCRLQFTYSVLQKSYISKAILLCQRQVNMYKIILTLIISGSMIVLPLYLWKDKYAILDTHLHGSTMKNVIVEKSDIGYSSRRNYYVYVTDSFQKIGIRVPFQVNNSLKTGDTITYRYIKGNSFGVYPHGMYPYDFVVGIVVIILGLAFLYCLFKEK